MTTGKQDDTKGTDAMPVGIASTDQLGAAPKRAVCAYCGLPDSGWSSEELARGKRALLPGPGVNYHCMNAFYGAS